MDSQGQSSEIISLYGPLRAIYLPADIALRDPAEIGRALAAWDYHLSNREINLLEHITEGRTNEQIVELLGVTELNTVKKQLKVLFKKLEVRNRVQAARVVLKYGLSAQ